MQMWPWFGEEEKIAFNSYMESGGWITEFNKTRDFEETIAEYVGAKHCIVVNNGTISLTLAALACEIVAGDEVIVPNYTMVATPNSVKFFGAVPVFVDVEPETLCLNIELVRKAITPRTKAIMLVSANGRYPLAGIECFDNFCEENNLWLIEDAAQSLGSFYPDGRHIGRAGNVGSFSFSMPKIISTGQGGALITDDDEIAFKLRRLKDFGREKGGLDIHESIGFNFKFTDLQAVIGIEQMKKLTWRVERKKDIMRLYQENLDNLNQLKFFEQDLENTTPWFIDVMAEKRDELMDNLKRRGIGTRVMYPPLNEQKAYHISGCYPVSKSVGEKGLWLPSASQLSDQQVVHICSVIADYYKI